MATQVTTGLLANNAVTDDKLHADFTATTQSASDNSTSVATTAYVTTAIANLADSAPSTLNTLNELAAALGDDANFSTTVTNSIATKLPLAGGDLTGRITITAADPGDNVSRLLDIKDSTAVAAGVGGGISFFGKYQGSSYSTYGQILGVKTNATSGDYSGYLSFKTRPDNALPVERLRINSDGNLQTGTSIGNSTYAGLFNGVANKGTSGAIIQTRNGDGNKHYIFRGDNNVEYGSLGLTSPTGTGLLQILGESGIAIRGASNADHIRIDSNGKVGIGTTTPQKTLHIEHTGGASEGILITGASDTAGHTAGILLRAEGGESDSDLRAKGAIFFERTGTYGVGKLHLANDTGGDNTSATISDAKFTIQANGGVSLTGNHQFNFRANGASNPGNGATIVFSTVKDGNAAGCYNTSNGHYEAQIAGWYMFSVGIRYDSISGTGYVRPQFAYIANGGSSWQYPHQEGFVDPIIGTDFGTGSYHYFPYTIPIYLAVGDTVRVVNNGNASNTVNANESHFGCIFMG